MPSSVLRPRWGDLVIAAAAISARLPFLLRADRFFNSDQAVEGLMARHIGDHPLFLWGQRYKGTPEVLITSAVFRIASPSVIALNAVTLACFVLFLCLNFRLIERTCSRRIAWMATAFFIAGPPSLVLWTLSGSAEIVMTFIAGAILLLAVHLRRWSVAAAALGAGLWIQQYILYYVASLVLAAVLTMPGWREIARDAIRTRIPPWLQAVAAALLAAASLYVVLGLVAFFSRGFDVQVVGVRITATHPQKMWWIAGVLIASAAVLGAAAVLREQLVAPGLAFLAGYAPAILGRIGNDGIGAPISRLDLGGLRAALPDIGGLMALLFGFWDPSISTTISLSLALMLAGVLTLSSWSLWRRKPALFFHAFFIVFPIVAVVMFLVSGSYSGDPQSYRYLMPIYAALPVVCAIGVDEAWRGSRAAGSVLLVLMLALFAAQQINWFVHLMPDSDSARVIACLDSHGIQAARGSYWQSYKIAFLTGERIIVSPTDGIDRYPAYSERTRSSPTIADAGCAEFEGSR